MEDLSFIVKAVIKDEQDNEFWIYKCKYCQHVHLTVDTAMLALIQKIEERKE